MHVHSSCLLPAWPGSMPADLCATLRRCSRVDSATLNLRPDEVDSESWRHGSFK